LIFNQYPKEISMAASSTIEAELKRPATMAESGLGTGMISDLAIKSIYFSGELSGAQLSQTLKLPYRGIVQPVLEFLDREELVGISGGTGTSERNFRYVLSRKGLDRVRDALSQNGYAGPAPIPLAAYNNAIRRQGLNDLNIREETVKAAYEGPADRFSSTVLPATERPLSQKGWLACWAAIRSTFHMPSRSMAR
jgi:hypothetical protein